MSVDTADHRLQRRRTRVPATAGPGSDAPDGLSVLVDAGVDVFRLNLSHGQYEDHARSYRRIRRAAEERGAPTGPVQEAVARATSNLFRYLMVRAIIVFT